MNKTLLIHGYYVGIYIRFLELLRLRTPFQRTVGFAIMEGQHMGAEVDTSEPTRESNMTTDYNLYCWYPDYSQLTWKDLFEVANPLKTYLREKKIVSKSAAQVQLYEKIQRERITTLICHSMGAFLVFNMINNPDLGLPGCVKTIVLVQADIPRTLLINNPEVYSRLQKKHLHFLNYHCFWDITLCLSGIINRYKPAGLFGYQPEGSDISTLITNRFFPLNRSLNVHNSSIGDRRFYREVERQLGIDK
ncbi:MAG: hypothetical protein ACOCXT_00015 [Candidatus Dojkabacteria bacterium]